MFLTVTSEEVSSHHVQEEGSTPVSSSSSRVEHTHSDSSNGRSKLTEQSPEHTSSQRHSAESAGDGSSHREEWTEHDTSEEVVADPSDQKETEESERMKLTEDIDTTPSESHTPNTPPHTGPEVGGGALGNHHTDDETNPQPSKSESTDDDDTEKSLAQEEYRKELLKQRERLLMQQQAEHRQQQQHNRQQYSGEQRYSGREEGSVRQELEEQREQLLRQQQMEQQRQEEMEIEPQGSGEGELKEDLLSSGHQPRAREDGDHPPVSEVGGGHRESGIDKDSVHHHRERAGMNRGAGGDNPSISDESVEESEVSDNRESEDGKQNLRQTSSDSDAGLPGESLEREGTRERGEEGVGEGTCEGHAPEDCPAEAKNGVCIVP